MRLPPAVTTTSDVRLPWGRSRGPIFPARARGEFPQWERKSSRPPRILSHASHPLHLLRDPMADAGACFPVRFLERVREHFTLDNFARIIEGPPRKSSTTRSDHWGQRLVRRDGAR